MRIGDEGDKESGAKGGDVSKKTAFIYGKKAKDKNINQKDLKKRWL